MPQRDFIHKIFIMADWKRNNRSTGSHNFDFWLFNYLSFFIQLFEGKWKALLSSFVARLPLLLVSNSPCHPHPCHPLIPPRPLLPPSDQGENLIRIQFCRRKENIPAWLYWISRCRASGDNPPFSLCNSGISLH